LIAVEAAAQSAAALAVAVMRAVVVAVEATKGCVTNAEVHVKRNEARMNFLKERIIAVAKSDCSNNNSRRRCFFLLYD